MVLKSPSSSRPGLTRSASKAPSLKRTSGRNLMVPTRNRGRPRVPRKPRVPKRRFVPRRAPVRTKPFTPATRRAVQKSVPQLAKTAAKRGALARVGALANRALGIYGAFSIISDVFEIAAPFVHDWLRGGWRGAEGREYAPTLGPPDFTGGQLNVPYTARAEFEGTYAGKPDPYIMGYSRGAFMGPVSGIEMRPAGDPLPDGRRVWGAWVVRPLSSDLAMNQDEAFSAISFEPPTLVGAEVTRVDGQPDTGGDPPGTVTRNSVYDNPTVRNPPEFPGPSTPLRNLVPAVPSVAPALPPTADPSDNPRLPSVLNPDALPGQNTTTIPLPGGETSTPTLPDYSTSQPRPTKPDSGGCSQSDTSPCSKSIFDYLEYIDDKLDREEDQCEECEEPQNLVLCNFTYVRCTEEGPVLVPASFFYDPNSYANLEEDLAAMSNLANKGCDVGESILAIPDSWQQRRQANAPVLVLTFKIQGTTKYHSYSIPHPASSQPIEEPPLDGFEKGNYLGIARLTDNSQIAFNCSTPDEAERVVSTLLQLVEPSFRSESEGIFVSERRGYPVNTGTMVPTSAIYYSEGRRDLRPSWRRSFTGTV